MVDSQRRSVRLRIGLRRIRWVAQFGGVPWAALAAGGCVGRLKVKSMVKSRRLRRALCNGGRGRFALTGGGRCLWSPSSRVPRRCRRPEGTIPSWRCPAASHAAVVRLRPAGHRQDGLVVQAPPTATRDPGPPHLWEGSPSLVHDDSPPRVRREVDPVHTTGVVSRIPRRCRRAKPSWPGRWCQAGRFRTPAGVIRLDTTGPACFRQATTATRDPGQRRPQATTATRQRDPALPPRCRAPAGGPALDLRRPPNAAASRPSDVCAVTRTGARSCPASTAGRQRAPATHHRTAPPSESFLNQCEAVRKRL